MLFRDGLLLALLVARPLRRANVTAVEIGRQLRRCGKHWRLHFTPAEMKSRRPNECSIPEELTVHLDRYLQAYRPTLLQCSLKATKPVDALWVSKQGTHMTSAAIYCQVKARTEEEFGTRINPHKFRSIYATDTAALTPVAAGSIKLGLGHASQTVLEEYYNLAQMVDAGQKYDDHDRQLAQSRPRPRHFRLS